MAALTSSVTIAILAGGRATRLPGKLERTVDGEPLLIRVYHRLRNTAPVVIAAAGSFPPALDEQLDCPLIIDRWPGAGPLGGLLSVSSEVTTEWIFAAAGDAPELDGSVIETLVDAASDEIDAVVPTHDGRLEPLATLYRRSALEREGHDVLRADRSMHALLARLRVRPVTMTKERFVNINTAADLEYSSTP